MFGSSGGSPDPLVPLVQMPCSQVFLISFKEILRRDQFASLALIRLRSLYLHNKRLSRVSSKTATLNLGSLLFTGSLKRLPFSPTLCGSTSRRRHKELRRPVRIAGEVKVSFEKWMPIEPRMLWPVHIELLR